MLTLLATLFVLQAPSAETDRSVYKIWPAIDVPVTIAAVSVVAIRAFATDAVVKPSCPCDPATLNSFDRGAVRYHNAVLQPVADVSLGLIIGVPIVLDLIELGFSKAFAEDFTVLFETLAINTAFQGGIALIVQRPRPLSYAGEPIALRGDGYTSFYAGHVATAVAAMAVVSQTLRLRYGIKVWPWILTAGVGTLMAVGRVGAGAHFPTDVIVGAVAGLAIGITVPWLHQRGHEEGQVRLVPALGGLGLAGQF